MRIDIRFIKDGKYFRAEVKNKFFGKWKEQGKVHYAGSGGAWIAFSSESTEDLVDQVLIKKKLRRDQVSLYCHGIIEII